MKILTAAEMREVDRLTAERGIPGLILMENAGSRVVDFLCEKFAPLSGHRILVVCGKGNNGGDGFVVARQLFTRKLCGELTVLEVFPPADLQGDAAANRTMLAACGCPVLAKFPNELASPTIVVDAILGSGLTGPAKGPALDAIRLINTQFPLAQKVAVDIPSGLPSDGSNPTGEFVRTHYSVTFTAPRLGHVLSPAYENVGELLVFPIGTPDDLCGTNPKFNLNLTTPADLRHLFPPRPKNSNKGMYGHVLVIGGSYGKSGAPAMSAVAAYRVGAGLVSVAIPSAALVPVAALKPELMTQPIDDWDTVPPLADKMSVIAVGPGLGSDPDPVRCVKILYSESDKPGVFDADALNALAPSLPHTGKIRVLTPHPGEMSRLTGKSTKDVQSDRLAVAQDLAHRSGATIVLKGDRTLIAFPDGETWVNPTGSPSMATGGTGDILTGMIAGIMGQHPDDWQRAIIAAVWLHGRCGELAAKRLGEQFVLAMDLLDQLPEAMNELRPAS